MAAENAGGHTEEHAHAWMDRWMDEKSITIHTSSTPMNTWRRQEKREKREKSVRLK